MSNTIHIFGDSFSVGYGLNPYTSDFPSTYRDFFKYTWVNELQRFYKSYKIENYAFPGASNDSIKEALLLNLYKIKKNDIVIYGITEPRRFNILVDPMQLHNQKHLRINSNVYTSYLQNLLKKQPKKNYLPPSLVKIFKRYKIDYKVFKACIDFYQHIILNKQFLQGRQHYNRLILNNLQRFFKESEIRFLTWDNTLWEVGENISMWSDNNYIDYHWSPNGNRTFLSMLLWSLENTFYTLDLDFFKNNKEKIKEFSKYHKLDEYIGHKPSELLI